MNDTFMKEKPIFPLLTSMALPMVVSMLVNALYNIVDSLFVARISEEAMTALSLVYPVQNLINAIAIGFSIGIAALISLHLGAGNKEKADMAATHGMVLSLIHGVVISIICTAIMPRFLRSFTSDETVIAMGVTYSRVAFMFAVVIMAAMAFEKIFQAVGRMNITMIGLMGGSVCNIILDPLLIFGICPFPQMGVADAALLVEQRLAHGGRGGHRAHRAVDLGGADGIGHLIVADEHAARHRVALHMPEGDVVGAGDSSQGRLVVERDAVLQGAPGDGAVHGPRVQAGEAEFFGHGLGHGGLAGPGGPVDGDDHYFTSSFKSARKSG